LDGKIRSTHGATAVGQLETQLHEQVHLWQQNFAKDPVRPGRSHHIKEFVSKCESLGLHPMPGVGCHIRLADGAFALLIKEMGIEPPDISQRPDDFDLDWFRWFLDSMGNSNFRT
jgi:hypothetical protein